MGTIFCQENQAKPAEWRKTESIMALFALLGLLALTSSAVANQKGPNCYLLQDGIEIPPECEKCRCKALSYWVFDDKYFVPECNTTDNTHMPKQCNQGFCFCVDKHGKEIADTRVPETTELDCDEISAAASMQDKVCPKKVETEFFKASCKQNGDFEAIQCMKGPASTRMCWCALPKGLMIPKTVYSPLTGPIPDCKRHINLAYDCEGREGTFPHPFDLNRYISCKEGGAYACACQPGLVYNPSKRVCAYTSKPDA